MKKFFRSAALAALVAAGTFAIAAPAQARDRWHDRGGGDDVAIAVGAGLVGLAIGAAIADNDDDRYYDRSYYNQRRYVRVDGYPDYYYYYDGHPNRYYRDRYYSRNYGRYYRHGYNRHYRGGYRENPHYGHRYSRNRWERREDRYERHHGDGHGYHNDWRRNQGRRDGRGDWRN